MQEDRGYSEVKQLQLVNETDDANSMIEQIQNTLRELRDSIEAIQGPESKNAPINLVVKMESLLKKYFSLTQSRENNHHDPDVNSRQDKVNGKTQAISYGAIMVLGEDSIPAGNDQPVDFSIADEQTDLNSSNSSDDDMSDEQVKKRGRRISRRTRKRPAKFRDYERSDSETSVTESEVEEKPKQEVVIVPEKPKKKKPKVSPKRHVLLPPQVVHKLKQWMLDHVDHPYPNDGEKNQLVQETGLTLRQLNDWFSNARRRWFLKVKATLAKSPKAKEDPVTTIQLQL